MQFTSTDLTRYTLVALSVFATVNMALASGTPCERLEYAQLKDLSKKELVEAYCTALAKADLNKDLRAITKEHLDKQLALGVNTSETFKEFKELGEAQVSCLKASEAASSMLTKKYKSKAPESCNK